MTQARRSIDVRSSIVEMFRRDLVGPGPSPHDADLAHERLNESPSRWYLTCFIAPSLAPPPTEEDDPSTQEEMELDAEEPDNAGAGGAAGDQDLPDPPVTRRRGQPAAICLTALLPVAARKMEADATTCG